MVDIKGQAELDSINNQVVDIKTAVADIKTANTVQTTFIINSADTILDMNMLNNYHRSIL